MTFRDSRLAVAGSLVLCAAGGVQAGDAAPAPPDGDTIGLALVVAPVHAGSDEVVARALPQFDFRWSNGIFLSATEGLGYQARSGPIAYGVQLTVDRGRREHDAADLRGLGDVPARPELGAFVQWPVAPGTVVSSSLRYGSGSDRRGLAWRLAATRTWPLATDWTALAGIGATWANRHQLQSYFGVTPAQAGASGLRPLTPADGLKDIGLSGGVQYRWTGRHRLGLGLQLTSLQGDAARSPLVRQRTAAGGMLSWTCVL